MKEAPKETQGYDLFDLGVLDGPRERPFDTIVDLVSELLDVPVALLTIIDDLRLRQHFKSQVGLAEPWRSRAETPLSHSFCKIVRDTGRMLLVRDSRLDLRVKDNLAIAELGVISYLGLPIYCPASEPVGALCAIDHKPRDWSERDRNMLSSLADLATQQIMLRASLETIKIIQSTIRTRAI